MLCCLFENYCWFVFCVSSLFNNKVLEKVVEDGSYFNNTIVEGLL